MARVLSSDQLPIKRPRDSAERTAEQLRIHRAQITIAGYADRMYPHPDPAPAHTPQSSQLTLELIDELGLNGRPMRSTKHGSHITPARVGASPPHSPHPGGPRREGP